MPTSLPTVRTRAAIISGITGVLVAALVFPGMAYAQEATSVITVEGSVASVTGTVTLDSASIDAIVAAYPEPTVVSTVTLDPVFTQISEFAYYFMLVGVFWLSLIAGVVVAGR